MRKLRIGRDVEIASLSRSKRNIIIIERTSISNIIGASSCTDEIVSAHINHVKEIIDVAEINVITSSSVLAGSSGYDRNTGQTVFLLI